MLTATLKFENAESLHRYTAYISKEISTLEENIQAKSVYKIVKSTALEITIEFAYWECEYVMEYVCGYDNTIALINMHTQ